MFINLLEESDCSDGHVVSRNVGFLLHCFKTLIIRKPSKKPGNFYHGQLKDSRQNSLMH